MSFYNSNDLVDPDGPPTRKQIAFLRYRKQTIPRGLTKRQASDLIDSAIALSSPEEHAKWKGTRRFLFPDLYYDEDVSEIGQELFYFVRDTIRPGSEKLTQKKIATVIKALDRKRRGWDMDPDRDQIFLAMLRKGYPGCCDEKGRPRSPHDARRRKTMIPCLD